MVSLVLTLVCGAADPPLSIGSRIYTRYVWEDAQPHHRIELRRSRLALDFAPHDWLRAELDFEVLASPALRDAWVELRPFGAELRITGGRFKKPFSVIELTSPGRLPLMRRGLVNDRVTNGLGFGGRDVGVALSGRAGALRWHAGVFDGDPLVPDSAKDFAARLELRRLGPLRLGASGAMTWRNLSTDRKALATALDVRVKSGPLLLVAEGILAQERLHDSSKDLAGGIAFATWTVELSEAWAVAPIVVLELLDEDIARRRSLVASYGGGVNVHLGSALRVMLQMERVNAQRATHFDTLTRATLQLAFDGAVAIVSGAPVVSGD